MIDNIKKTLKGVIEANYLTFFVWLSLAAAIIFPGNILALLLSIFLILFCFGALKNINSRLSKLLLFPFYISTSFCFICLLNFLPAVLVSIIIKSLLFSNFYIICSILLHSILNRKKHYNLRNCNIIFPLFDYISCFLSMYLVLSMPFLSFVLPLYLFSANFILNIVQFCANKKDLNIMNLEFLGSVFITISILPLAVSPYLFVLGYSLFLIDRILLMLGYNFSLQQDELRNRLINKFHFSNFYLGFISINPFVVNNPLFLPSSLLHSALSMSIILRRVNDYFKYDIENTADKFLDDVDRRLPS